MAVIIKILYDMEIRQTDLVSFCFRFALELSEHCTSLLIGAVNEDDALEAKVVKKFRPNLGLF